MSSLAITTRDQWGALPQAQVEHRAWPAHPPLVVHHTVTEPPAATCEPRQEAAIMRGFDRHHFYTNGWRGGIGYSYVIFPSGRVYAGRGRHTVGAHSPGANHLPGVAMVGTFTEFLPTPESLDALRALAVDLGATELKGHRDFYATACPGAALYALLPELRLTEPRATLAPPLPHGATLRLMVRGNDNFPLAGWTGQMKGALRAIAKKPLEDEPLAADGRHWIAWNHGTWFGAKDVTNVAIHLVRKFDLSPVQPTHDMDRAADNGFPGAP